MCYSFEKSSSAYGIKREKNCSKGKEFISHLFNKLVIIKINESDKNVDGDANAGLCEHNDPHRRSSTMKSERLGWNK